MVRRDAVESCADVLFLIVNRRPGLEAVFLKNCAADNKYQ